MLNGIVIRLEWQSLYKKNFVLCNEIWSCVCRTLKRRHSDTSYIREQIISNPLKMMFKLHTISKNCLHNSFFYIIIRKSFPLLNALHTKLQHNRTTEIISHEISIIASKQNKNSVSTYRWKTNFSLAFAMIRNICLFLAK